jgi:hypothetical protein
MQERRSQGPIDAWCRQDAARCISRIRLALKELETAELRSRGASRVMADRYLEIESAMRSLADFLGNTGSGTVSG